MKAFNPNVHHIAWQVLEWSPCTWIAFIANWHYINSPLFWLGPVFHVLHTAREIRCHSNFTIIRTVYVEVQPVHMHTHSVYTEVHTSTCIQHVYISHTCTHTSLTSTASKNEMLLQCATVTFFPYLQYVLTNESMTSDINIQATTCRILYMANRIFVAYTHIHTLIVLHTTTCTHTKLTDKNKLDDDP